MIMIKLKLRLDFVFTVFLNILKYIWWPLHLSFLLISMGLRGNLKSSVT